MAINLPETEANICRCLKRKHIDNCIRKETQIDENIEDNRIVR